MNAMKVCACPHRTIEDCVSAAILVNDSGWFAPFNYVCTYEFDTELEHVETHDLTDIIEETCEKHNNEKWGLDE